MLCDSPSQYQREPEIMEFLSRVPTVWDETVVPDAKVGEYVVVARKNGDEWYVGAMTNWTPRALDLDLSFLGAGEFTAQIYSDGINADKYGSDYRKTVRQVSMKDRLTLVLAPGGGWAARIYASDVN
jgi:alpha-glucosidase